MTDDTHAHDPLEEELGKLRPCELSDGFVERLGQRLEPPTNRDDRAQLRRLGLLRLLPPAAAVAALILVAVWLVRNQPFRQNSVPSKQEVAAPLVEPREQRAREVPEPTLLAYSQAVGNQQRDLDDLLDYHARTLLPNVPDPVAVDQLWP